MFSRKHFESQFIRLFGEILSREKSLKRSLDQRVFSGFAFFRIENVNSGSSW